MLSYRALRVSILMLLAVSLVLGLGFATTPVQAAGKARNDDNGNMGNARILPPASMPYGHSYSEWQALWWQWAVSLPADASHPFFFGGDPLRGQTAPVYFLAGVFGFEERWITIPAGTALFFPVINAECSTVEPDPFHGDDEASLRACAKSFIDQTSGLAAAIDGVPVGNLPAYRQQSVLYHFGPLPDPNLFGVPAGTEGMSVDDGYYLFVAPFSVGEHTIYFKGTFDVFGAGIETMYHVTVTPNGAPGALSSDPAGSSTSPAGAPPLTQPSTWGRVKASYR